MPMKKYSFPFFESKSLVPFIKFTTEEGKDIFALVDSGSERTCSTGRSWRSARK